jgi:hypothetical protein
MNAHEQLEGRTVTVPDLNVTMDASGLICSVFNAVQQTNWPVSRALRPEVTPEPVLQSLLTYCYAVGILASEEIESAVWHEPAVNYLCANYEPDAQAIRNFRRRHATFLKGAVANLFKLLASAVDENYSDLSMRRLERFSPNQSFLTLASQRIARAIKADSHALDV